MPGKFEVAATERGCYCGLWDTNPQFYASQGLPPGFCGKCERCGALGHTRHFPGPLPYTGSWCDRCYRVLVLTWPFRSLAGWVHIALFLVLGAALITGVVSLGKRLLG